MAEQLFASFILDRDQGLEIAIAADSVTEATSITEKIQPLLASVSFLEGIMHLRDEVIPIINMKKRMGLPGATGYDADAKIAVVRLANQSFGLLFDDIQEVLRIDDSLLTPIQPALQSESYVVSDLITLKEEHRTLEVLNLEKLFEKNELLVNHTAVENSPPPKKRLRTYSRYVIFSSGGAEYGIPVENSRELTFSRDLDHTFKTGLLEGALQLRGHTIPVISGGALLQANVPDRKSAEATRILIMATDALHFGILIDDIREILSVCSEDIFQPPRRRDNSIIGVCEPQAGRNIMLLDVVNLVACQMDFLQSMARIKTEEQEQLEGRTAESKHLITENCYLIFSIERNFGIELKNVREIIEHAALLSLPGAEGFDSQLLNLRGQIIPVVNLRTFYNYPKNKAAKTGSRLIICQHKDQVVALEVDSIVSIHKQEELHETPSLNPQLQERKDTLNRLIEFVGEQGIKEQVLVVNIANLMDNHLQSAETDATKTDSSF